MNFVYLKLTIKHTTYLFGPTSEIEGKKLQLIEQNSSGDCLCIFDNKNLVDVDKRDIEKIDRIPDVSDFYQFENTFKDFFE